MLNADSQPPYPGPIEILLVDDHHYVRRLLPEIIETYKDLSIVGEAVNGDEAVLLAAKLKPAAIVMDIHLPVLCAAAAATLIKINNPFVSIIALTAGDPNALMRLMGGIGMRAEGPCAQAIRARGEKKAKREL